MANVKASTLSNGINTAYFPNALKVEGERLVLYNEENDSIRSSIFISDMIPNSSGGSDPRLKVFYASDFISQAEAGSNCTSRINALVEEVYDNGGGIIKFDGYIYKFSALYLFSNVYLEGCGTGNTIFQRIGNTQITDVIDTFAVNGSGFISIEQHATNFGIKDITIYGSPIHNLNNVDGIDHYSAGESDIVDGIVLADCFQEIGYTNGSAKIIDHDVLYTNIPIPNNSAELRPHKYAKFENIDIIGFSGCGLYIGRYCKDVILNNVRIMQNMAHGLFNYGSECYFNNVICEFNGAYGIYEVSDKNSWSNIKSLWNGFYDHTVFGIYTEGSEDRWNDVEVSDNWCGGILIKCSNSSFTNMLVRTNGYRSSNALLGEDMTPTDSDLIVVQNSQKCIIQAIITHHRSDLGTVAKTPLSVNAAAKYNIFDITQAPGVGSESSDINGNTLSDNIINNTISDNIVRYLQS